MAKIVSLSEVGVFVRDQRAARDFYVKKLGLHVRSSMPRVGYLALGATKGGEDASLNLWQPTPEAWGPNYEKDVQQIGVVTGIGFRTTNLEKTIADLRRKKVKVEGPGEEGEGRLASIFDPDGNVAFAYEPRAPKVRRAGLLSLDFVTIASRDAARTGEFYTKTLGMKGKVLAGEGLREYRLSPKGTALAPFTPDKEVYEDPKDFEEDMAHIGENTTVMFSTDDIYAVQEKLLAKGVRFLQRAETQDWGGIQAKFLDPDDNYYNLYQMTS